MHVGVENYSEYLRLKVAQRQDFAASEKQLFWAFFKCTIYGEKKPQKDRTDEEWKSLVGMIVHLWTGRDFCS